MTLTLHHMPLAAARIWWRGMAALQTDRPVAEYLAALESYARAGAFVILARQGCDLVGSMCWMRFRVPGVPCPGGTMVRALVYVAPEARGQGVGHAMRVRMEAEARARGFLYCISWGYETAAIAAWVERQPGKIDLGFADPGGFPVYLMPLAETDTQERAI